MIRTQIQLTEEQARRIKKLAQESGLSMAEMIRRGTERLLNESPRESRGELRARAKAAIGRFESGIQNTSERHDEAVADAYQ